MMKLTYVIKIYLKCIFRIQEEISNLVFDSQKNNTTEWNFRLSLSMLPPIKSLHIWAIPLNNFFSPLFRQIPI